MIATLSAGDRLEIHELLARYAWSLDTGDEDAFVGCFCQRWRAGLGCIREPTDAGRAARRCGASSAYFRSRPESAGRQHHVSNCRARHDRRGSARQVYVLVALRADEGPHRLNVMGYYEDELRRQGRTLAIARRVIRDWSGPVLASFAGQDGARQARQRPAALDGLWATQAT